MTAPSPSPPRPPYLELYKSLNPHSTRMPYVYDHFLWQHCDDSGYRFSQDFAAVDS